MRNRTRSTFLALAASLALAPAAAAQPLDIVSVGAPAINCLFSVSCTVTVNDLAPPYLTNGFVQSRTFQGQPGSPAAGKWVYEYRIDLTNVSGFRTTPQVTHIALPWPAPITAMNFNGDRSLADSMFVVTSGGLGAVGPSSAYRYGDTIHVSFAPPVNGGQTSYFFGIVTDSPPQELTARVTANVAPETFITVQAPQFMAFDAAPPTPGVLRPGTVRPGVPRPGAPRQRPTTKP